MADFGFVLSKTFATTKKTRHEWPYVPGKYFVLDSSAPVAATTLGSLALAAEISEARPNGLCIVGKVETENIGIEKIIKNVLSNPAIRYLICAGDEPPKHLTGATLIALFQNGIDERNRIIGSPGMRPILPNTSVDEVQAFRKKVEPVDMIGCSDVVAIHGKIAELAETTPKAAGTAFIPPADLEGEKAVERVIAEGTDPNRIKLDKAGYFVVNIEDGVLLVEHYSYKERLIRVIEGRDARSIYLTLVRNGWISKLDHAAYIGKELTKAELSIKYGFEFVQDGG